MCTTPTSLPTIFTFYAGSGQYLNWYLQDSTTNQPIDNSVITATLYSGRSLTDPVDFPGTPVANFTGVTLAYVPRTLGQYQVIIPATFNPPLGTNYVLVVDAVTPGYNPQHWEIAAQVVEGTVTITTNNLIVQVSKFRNDFPEFANTAAYPDSSICFWMGIAGQFLNACRWGCNLALGAELYTAHMIVLEKKDVDAANAGGWPGISKGAINNEQAGQVSVGYEVVATLDEGAGHWGLTVYGSRFLRIARMMGAGPIQIGPCGGWGAGSVPGLYNGAGGAWSGPPMNPGYLS